MNPVTPTPRSNLYVHPSWLAKLMSGDNSCNWSGWYRARFQNFEDPGLVEDFTASNLAHTRILSELRQERRNAGDVVLQEGQGSFRYKRPSGLVITGRPDLISISPDKTTATVWDAKSGKIRSSHKVQLMIYIHCLLLTTPALRNYELGGVIRYLDSTELRVTASEVRGQFRDHFEYFITVFESSIEPDRVPSRYECRYCKISSTICSDKMTTDPDDDSDYGADLDD